MRPAPKALDLRLVRLGLGTGPTMKGQVVEVAGGAYSVQTEDGVVLASLRGRIKLDHKDGDRVVIGDRVEVLEGNPGEFTIEGVEPRETRLVRRSLGGRRFKIVAANLDRLVVLASIRDPAPSFPVIDRMLVMGESGGLECVLLFTKVDLVQDEAEVLTAAADYRTAGYAVYPISVETGQGIDEVTRLLCSGSSALVGPSGVGKSTLINRIEPSVSLLTKEVGQRSRAGRHTTVSSRLVSLGCGGRVADTPGFSEVGLGDVEAVNLAQCFPEFRPYLADCHFRDCTHVHEPGCSVLAALEEGKVHARRHASYAEILAELG